MPRLLFEKTGRGVWISHLDLMRLFQRAFKRADLPLTHTQGFNPRASVSIALPLSVGVESACELLDFELDGQTVSCDEICNRLNNALVDGVKVLEVYETGRKIRDLSLLHCVVTLEYDSGVPAGAQSAIENLFSQESVIVPKKTKNGIQDQNIIPMIRRLSVVSVDPNTIELDALVCCQNPTLNPAQLALAVEMHLPDYKADFSKSRRVEIYDQNENVFR
ncbi:MAG: TIGR03936 family radical SAM-associated protein [Oscillospiraceae bacterium]|nr:TIGR03936 family radical SAM-associated protein [Oscillospiraceae bacterium]